MLIPNLSSVVPSIVINNGDQSFWDDPTINGEDNDQEVAIAALPAQNNPPPAVQGAFDMPPIDDEDENQAIAAEPAEPAVNADPAVNFDG